MYVCGIVLIRRAEQAMLCAVAELLSVQLLEAFLTRASLMGSVHETSQSGSVSHCLSAPATSLVFAVLSDPSLAMKHDA